MAMRDRLLDAALDHVIFDGWGPAALAAARADTGLSEADLKSAFPRGAVDMALAYHSRGDAAMVARLAAEDISTMRFRDRIAYAVRVRLEVVDKELVRRGMSLFALPAHGADGSRAVWHTAGLIWDTLGDTSRDVNWYTKRASLAAVYSATALYWLGDESPGAAATWGFLDRRIDNVMTYEKWKAQVKASRLGTAFMNGPGRVLDVIRAPGARGGWR